eukprot:scaffold18468_cov48-Phaeocystis_antarctica.AAC.4
MAQNVNLRRTAVFLSVSFLAGWGCFPIVRGSRVEHAKGLCCAITARLPARTASYIYIAGLRARPLGPQGHRQRAAVVLTLRLSLSLRLRLRLSLALTLTLTLPLPLTRALFVLGDMLSKNVWVATAVWRGHLIDLHHAQEDSKAGAELSATTTAGAATPGDIKVEIGINPIPNPNPNPDPDTDPDPDPDPNPHPHQVEISPAIEP